MVKIDLKIFSIGAVLLLAGLWPYGLQANALEHSPEVKRLIAAAKEKGEGELNLTWGQQSFSGPKGARIFQELFNRMYGINIKVNFTPGPRMSQMASKISQEVSAGKKASSDMLLGTELHYGRLLKRGVLEEYDYTKLSQRITKNLVTSNNTGVEIATFVSGIVYNTNAISAAEAPKKLEDVLKNKWKGKIASTPYASQLYNMAYVSTWSPEKMTAFVTRLTGHVAGLIRCGELSRIATGEFVLMVMGCGSYAVRQERARGAPLAHVILEDGATVSFFYWGVPKTSSHPNLAKLFINMAMSEEGQRVVYQTYDTDHYLLPHSQSVAELKGLKSKGIEILEMDADYVAGHPGMGKLARRLAKILRKKK